MRTMSHNKPKPPIPHIQKLINECYQAMVDAINDECNGNGSEDARSTSCTVNTNDGYIDLWMYHCGNTELSSSTTTAAKASVRCCAKQLRTDCPTGARPLNSGRKITHTKTNGLATALPMKQTTFAGDTDRFLCFS